MDFLEKIISSHNAGISIYGTNVLKFASSDLTTITTTASSNIINKDESFHLITNFNSGDYEYIVFRF